MSNAKPANKFASKVTVSTGEKKILSSAKTTAKAGPTPKAEKAAKVSAPKVAAPKAEKAAKAVVDTRTITVLSAENPKRAGSNAYKTFELYKKSATVAAFLKAGGTTADLRFDEKAGFIKVA